MEENQKKEVAIFRFSVISDFIQRKGLSRGEITKMLQEKCARKWDIPYSERSRISQTTIKEWIKRYKDSGYRLESLYPNDRSDTGSSRALSDETAQSLLLLRRELPNVPLTVFMQEANSRGIIPTNETVSYSTLYRLMRTAGLNKGVPPEATDRRKFEAEYPNALWQSDVMHGPYVEHEGKKKKTYLIAIIDDMSRLVVHAEFYFSEKADNYMNVFQHAVSKRGIPEKLYVDNGSAFRSKHLEHVCACLGSVLIHSRPYSPQGKGKVERWFGTVRSGFISRYPDVNDITELNRLLDDWVDDYNNRIHSSTKTTPLKRFSTGLDNLRMPPSNLKDYFRKSVRRTVSKDRTITLNGFLFEAPVSLIGKRIEVLYHEAEPEQVEVKYDGKSYGIIIPVNVHANGRVKRKKKYPELESFSCDLHTGGLFGGER